MATDTRHDCARVDAMPDTHALFAELEATLTNGQASQRFSILRKITDLFLAEVDTYSDDHVAVFDELMSRLIDRIESQALIELSGKLAPIARAPVNVIGRLSHDDDISIAGPVLEQSSILTDDQLVEIARTKSQAHLSAIARRARINEPITDVLIDRGSPQVARKVAENAGARFSRFGFDTAVSRAVLDESLALALVDRMNLPADLLDQLVRRATATVRRRLLANARPEMRQRITNVLATISDHVSLSVTPAETAAMANATMRQDPVDLKTRIAQCVESRNAAELIDALAALSEIPVKAVTNLIQQASNEALIVLGKAYGIGWPDLEKMLAVALPTKSAEDINAMFASYSTLSTANAQRAVRFMRTSRSKFTDGLRKLA
jgi:hypothetical protein